MIVAYVDMIGGASGNMLIGALVDAGANFDEIVVTLQTLPIHGWAIDKRRVERRGQPATYVDVVIPCEDDHHDHPAAHRHPPGRRRVAEIVQIFERSALSPSQMRRASAIARRLAGAEAAVRGAHVETMPFHPVGQLDAILDIAGCCVALDLLGVQEVYCSPFPVGSCLPDETAYLLGDAPRRKEHIDAEMVTVTGAAILTTLVREAGAQPVLTQMREGYGAGRSDFPIPNVTRIEVGELRA